jgi:hypothetical protein
MPRSALCLLAALLLPAAASAADLGSVTKTLRPQLRTFDDKGAPLGQVPAASLKLPAPIVAMGTGNSVGVRLDGKVVYLRGLDVLTSGGKANCRPVQSAARAAGSSYAASNMGLGGAADCSPAGQ